MKSAPKQHGANNTGSKENRGSKTLRKAAAGRDRLSIETEGFLIVGEDASEFEEFAAKIIQEWNPVGSLEQELVERVVSLLWRQKRIPRLEAAVIAARDAATVMNSPVQQHRATLDYRELIAARYVPKGEQNEHAPSVIGPGSNAAQEKPREENKRSGRKRRSVALSYMMSRMATS